MQKKRKCAPSQTLLWLNLKLEMEYYHIFGINAYTWNLADGSLPDVAWNSVSICVLDHEPHGAVTPNQVNSQINWMGSMVLAALLLRAIKQFTKIAFCLTRQQHVWCAAKSKWNCGISLKISRNIQHLVRDHYFKPRNIYEKTRKFSGHKIVRFVCVCVKMWRH